MNGTFQNPSDNNIFTGFHRRDDSISAFSTATMSPNLPSFSRTLSHADSYPTKNGYSTAMPNNERNLSRTTTSSSISQSRTQNNGIGSTTNHNGYSSNLLSTLRQPQMDYGSPSSYDTTGQPNGTSYDLVTDFSNMAMQNLDRSDDPSGMGFFTNGLDASGRESSMERSRYQMAQALAYSGYSAQTMEQPQNNQYQFGQQEYNRPARGTTNGYMTQSSHNHRRPGHTSSYSTSSNSALVQDMLNPSNGTIASRHSNQPVAMLDRKLRVLSPLQQEPASYIPGQMQQAGQLQPQMQYPYESFGYAAMRANSLVNPYIIPTAYVNYGQQAMAPQFTTTRNSEPVRSQKLEEFRQNVKNNKRHELKVRMIPWLSLYNFLTMAGNFRKRGRIRDRSTRLTIHSTKA